MNEKETKQERREKKRRKMPQHGRSLSKVYKDAILKKAQPGDTGAEAETG